MENGETGLGCHWGWPLAGSGDARRVLSTKLWIPAQQPWHYERPGFGKPVGDWYRPLIPGAT